MIVDSLFIVYFCVWSMFCSQFCHVLPSFAIILMGKRAGCFTLVVILVACDCLCSVTLHCVSMCWSAVCDYGIS